ncbi:hypothetical protein BKA83DRAFT_4314128 [Pisolithus microcarpus]|nr:hypothetical protein BKA83DRAFT_4314128 [Pisolithus microcarpus]
MVVWTSLALLTSLQPTLTIRNPPARYRRHFEGMKKSRSSRMRMRATCVRLSSRTLPQSLQTVSRVWRRIGAAA